MRRRHISETALHLVMTIVVWCSLGMCLSAALIHGALALRRPIKRQYMAFALLMVLASIYYYIDARMYRTASLEAAIASSHKLGGVSLVVIACFAWFVREYTQIRPGRVITGAFWGCLLGCALYNVLSPAGFYVGRNPQLVTVHWLGSDVQIVMSQFGPAQIFYFLFVAVVFAVAMGGGLLMVRRGDRRRGGAFAFGVGLLFAAVIADLVHELIGGRWLYLSEFSFAVMSVIMAIQLAIDFRTTDEMLATTLRRIEAHTAELARALEKALAVRDILNTPLQTLSLQLSMHPARTPHEAALVASLQRDVDELAGIGRSIMPVFNGDDDDERPHAERSR